MTETIDLVSRYGMHTEEYSSLVQHRVRETPLVASHHDSFALEEDDQLTELIFEEHRGLDINLRYAPHFEVPVGMQAAHVWDLPQLEAQRLSGSWSGCSCGRGTSRRSWP